MDNLLRFDEYQEWALYDPTIGFFAQQGSAGGRRGDFVTSVEIGPLFGAVLGRYLDAEWERLGQPEDFWVYELGAGRGTLALGVRAGKPACQSALRYVCIERSERLRAEQREQAHALSGVNLEPLDPGPSEPLEHVFTDQATSMQVYQSSELPAGTLTGVVLANELLDNIPTRVLRCTSSGEATATYEELWVQQGPDEANHAVWFPLEEISAQYVEALGLPEMHVGAEFPYQEQAVALVHELGTKLIAGSLLFFDYMRPTNELAVTPRSEWLRTYRSHERGDDPLQHPGSQDITCDVAVDQIMAVLGNAAVTEQHEWLRSHGIDELVEEGKAAWHRSAAAPTLAALQGRSRVREAEALTDPNGLGGFGVIEWRR